MKLQFICSHDMLFKKLKRITFHRSITETSEISLVGRDRNRNTWQSLPKHHTVNCVQVFINWSIADLRSEISFCRLQAHESEHDLREA
jgi:hypothetical protein